jgi:AcrR family transcriptional regulator
LFYMSSLPASESDATESANLTDRERILTAAHELYLQHGIAAVAMTDLARHLHLSESQILHFFPSKEPLVWAVINEISYALHATLSQYKARSSNAVEELLALRDFFTAQTALNSSFFFQQLAADYPACQERWRMLVADFPADYLRHNLRWGMLQELYSPHLEMEALLQQVVQQQDWPPSELLTRLLTAIVTPIGALQVQRLTSPSSTG